MNGRRPPLYALRIERTLGASQVRSVVPETIRRARFVAATVTWTADATVGNRVLTLFVVSKDGLVKLASQSQTTQAASTTRGYVWSPAVFGVGVSTLNPFLMLPGPPSRFIIEGGDAVSITDSDSISAADTILLPVLFLDVEEDVGLLGGGEGGGGG